MKWRRNSGMSVHHNRDPAIRLCLSYSGSADTDSALHRQPDEPELHQPEAHVHLRLQAG